MSELTREQVEDFAKFLGLENLSQAGSKILAHDAALRTQLQAQGERVEKLENSAKKFTCPDCGTEFETLCLPLEERIEIGLKQIATLQQLATVEQVNQRVMQLEVVIRKSCGPELNCLSNMGIGFIEKAVYWYQQQLLTCEARVWEEAAVMVEQACIGDVVRDREDFNDEERIHNRGLIDVAAGIRAHAKATTRAGVRNE